MSRSEVEQRARDLLARMSLNERLAMMDGDLPLLGGLFALTQRDYYHKHPFPAGRNERLGIDGVQFIDGPRGIVLEGGATTFPVTMARGATFDPELEERIGDAIGKELRSHGGNLFGGVCINLLRHPAWGRAQETYGEDSYHLGVMGSALVRGVERHAMACIKHFAANSMEDARFQVDVRMSPRVLHEIYLPHFKACIDAGASAVMSAYNAVNGQWCGQSKALLTDILRDRWGFDGFVLTDFMLGLRDAELGALAGQNLEMPFRFVYREKLKAAVTEGRVPRRAVDDSVLAILRKLLELPPASGYPKSVRACADHVALAREASRKSMVLLRNERAALPVRAADRVAMIGDLCAKPNLGDRGSSDGRPEYVITPLEGMRARLGDRVHYDSGADVASAVAAAENADVAFIFVGYTHREEGKHIAPPSVDVFVNQIPAPRFFAGRRRRWWTRLVRGIAKPVLAYAQRELESDQKSFSAGGDRASLRLRQEHVALIRAVSAANKRTVVVIMAGSAVLSGEWDRLPAAILLLWYPGMEGGHAFADVVMGDHAPSGRLPFVIPTDEAHLPAFDRDAHSFTYDLWHGYRKLARDGVAPAYAFGFGLSYTTFAYRGLTLGEDRLREHDTLALSVEVENLGACRGEEVVQLYVTKHDPCIPRAPRVLAGFARVALDPGEKKSVTLAVPIERMAYFDEHRDGFVVEPGTYRAIVGRHERDDALGVPFEVVGT